MSYGFYRTKKSTRFANMKPYDPNPIAPLAKVERVEFRKTEPQETPMPTLEERIVTSVADAAKGDASFADAALEQQKIAKELFPQARSVGEAMHLYGKTETGRNHIAFLARAEFMKQQFDTRCGDGVLPWRNPPTMTKTGKKIASPTRMTRAVSGARDRNRRSAMPTTTTRRSRRGPAAWMATRPPMTAILTARTISPNRS